MNPKVWKVEQRDERTVRVFYVHNRRNIERCFRIWEKRWASSKKSCHGAVIVLAGRNY